MPSLKSTLHSVDQWLKSQPDIQIAVVYGSFASGRAATQSDLDIGVALDHTLSFEEKNKLVQSLSQATKREVDLIDLREATGTVLKEALTRGKILTQKNPLLFSRILKRMWIDGEDFEKQRASMFTSYRKRIFNG